MPELNPHCQLFHGIIFKLKKKKSEIKREILEIHEKVCERNVGQWE